MIQLHEVIVSRQLQIKNDFNKLMIIYHIQRDQEFQIFTKLVFVVYSMIKALLSFKAFGNEDVGS